ncbi:MAG TPA: S1C family serine protease [Bacillales bacterium]|nr:S1C family serine protease [Bacillales bacterium]
MDMLSDSIFGLLRIFLQPLFYILLVFAAFVSYHRVLRERRDFRVRIYGVFDGIAETIFPGLVMGLAGSILLLAAGVVLPPGMLALIAALYILAALTMQLRLMSPVFTVGVAVLAGFLFPDVRTGVGFIDDWIQQIRGTSASSSALLLGFLILMEGVMIRLRGIRTTPRLLPGKRGKTIGAHEARKFWFVPLCLLLPGGVIPDFGMWPFTNSGAEGFSLLLVPFGFGFYRLVTDTQPKQAITAAARRQIWIGLLVAVLAGIAWYTDIGFLAPVAAGLAVLLGIVTAVFDHVRRKRDTVYFRQRNDGLMVLGVLPGSAAEKLGVHVGECIQKVNGQPVSDENDFYEALQQNAAFCKLEVAGENGEIRFVQGALYDDGVYHELGLLFVAPPKAVL